MPRKANPHSYKEHFISAVVKRSGICRATVEQVLPAVFDEIRFQLTEGSRCVPVENFGTFAVIDIPERQYHYTYGGRDEIKTVAPRLRLKFAPTKNLSREVKEEKYDPTRRSFTHHPSEPHIRLKHSLRYRAPRDPNNKTFWAHAMPHKAENYSPTPNT